MIVYSVHIRNLQIIKKERPAFAYHPLRRERDRGGEKLLCLQNVFYIEALNSYFCSEFPIDCNLRRFTSPIGSESDICVVLIHRLMFLAIHWQTLDI